LQVIYQQLGDSFFEKYTNRNRVILNSETDNSMNVPFLSIKA